MDKQNYNLVVGVILLITSIAFFVMPVFFELDAFIPLMFAFISFIIALIFFIMGYSEK